MSYPNISDLTVDEFRNLIREVVTETLLDLFDDPDEGLELQEEVADRLRQSITATLETHPAQDVAEKLGLEW